MTGFLNYLPQIFLFVILFVYKVSKGIKLFLFVFLFVYTKGAGLKKRNFRLGFVTENTALKKTSHEFALATSQEATEKGRHFFWNVAMARILGGPRNRRARHGPRAVGAADGTSGTAVARGFGRTTARWRPTRARRGGQELAGRLSATSFERRRW